MTDVDVYDFEIGQKFKRQGIRGSEVWHIRAIVDDYQVVLRRWVKGKNYWNYFIIDDYDLTLRLDYGLIEWHK